jgi:hypothetical protein
VKATFGSRCRSDPGGTLSRGWVAVRERILPTAIAAAGCSWGSGGFRLRGVIDDELSRAVVAYIRGAGLAWPHRSLEAVAEALGADAAERLGSRLKQLADESVYWPVDWDRQDLLSATEGLRGGLTEAHPELSGEAVEALVWDFSYAHW